jgi:hypothetical protein
MWYRGNGSRSSNKTLWPYSASSALDVDPAGPPPMTIASYSALDIDIGYQRRISGLFTMEGHGDPWWLFSLRTL